MICSTFVFLISYLQHLNWNNLLCIQYYVNSNDSFAFLASHFNHSSPALFVWSYLFKSEFKIKCSKQCCSNSDSSVFMWSVTVSIHHRHHGLVLFCIPALKGHVSGLSGWLAVSWPVWISHTRSGWRRVQEGLLVSLHAQAAIIAKTLQGQRGQNSLSAISAVCFSVIQGFSHPEITSPTTELEPDVMSWLPLELFVRN